MKKILGIMLVLAFLAVSGYASESQWLLDVKASKVTFTLSSTLHDVTGAVNDYQGYMNLTEDSRKASGEGVFSISSMSTGNKVRDRKMKNMFDAERFPQITYRFEDSILPETSSMQTELHGSLTIREITHLHPVNVSVVRRGDEMILTGETDISLKDYHLKPPSVMGMIKVDDLVRVNLTIVYRKNINADMNTGDSHE